MTDASTANKNKPPRKGAPAIEGALSPEAKMRMKKTAELGKKTLKIVILLVLLGIICISSFLWYVFYGPRWGTMHYGVCKIFAERHVFL